MKRAEFLRDLRLLEIAAAIGNFLYHVVMGVIFGFALGSILFPFWS